MTDWITGLLHKGDDRRSTGGRRGGLLRHGVRGIARELENVLIQQLGISNIASYHFLVRANKHVPHYVPHRPCRVDHRVMVRPLCGAFSDVWHPSGTKISNK